MFGEKQYDVHQVHYRWNVRDPSGRRRKAEWMEDSEALDQKMQEVLEFEEDLKQKLKEW